LPSGKYHPDKEFRVSAARAEFEKKFSVRVQLVDAGVEDFGEIALPGIAVGDSRRPIALFETPSSGSPFGFARLSPARHDRDGDMPSAPVAAAGFQRG
jgi:hypothetical protein